MRPLAIALTALVVAGAVSACSSNAVDVPIYPMPFKAADGHLQIYDGTTFKPVFIKGMNMGISLPGTQPGELLATEEDYDRWLGMMAELGINVVRLYTLHYPRFYKRLLNYNVLHPDKPIYLFQGIWLDEDDPTNDLRDMQSSYDDNIVETIKCVHGENYVFERPGLAYGEFDADVSPWVMGWLVGREVFPIEVATTDKLPDARSSYSGAYVSLPSGNETSVWWAQRIDEIATYEAERYKVFRPISVSSWPTLDPLRHPSDAGSGEDEQQLDLAGLDTSRFPAGYFASYHAYPYYPDFMNDDPLYAGEHDSVGPNTYVGYLKQLRAHYFPKPLVIAEVGVPSSWGNAHFASSGMSHGGQDEIKQGNDDVRLFRDAYETGTGGAIVFGLLDEWWKRTWIVDELAFPRERYRLWHNLTSPEQNFGLLGFQLDPPDYGAFEPVRSGGRIAVTSLAADAEYFHVKVTLASPLAEGESMTIGYDTYADDLGESVLPNGKQTTQRSELALTITRRSAELMVMAPYDQFGVWHDTQDAWHDKTVSQLPSGRPYRSVRSDGGPWNLVRWKNGAAHESTDGTLSFPETVQDIGKLRVRDVSEQDTGQWAVLFDGATITVRVPWTLLQVTDPSDPHVLHDDPTTRPRETLPTDGFRIAVSLGDELIETARFLWKGWETVPAYKERRKLSYFIFLEGLKTVPDL